jgi:hypothetical protein
MSKKKTILEESTIRRFMKLADLAPLGENYFSKEEEIFEEEEDEVAFDAEAEEEPMGDEMPEEEPMGDEMAAEEPVESAAGEVSEEAVKEIVDAIASAVSEVTGVSVEAVGGEEEMEPVEEPEMEEEPADELGGEESFDAEEAEEEAPAMRDAYEESVDPEADANNDDDDDLEEQEQPVQAQQKISNDQLVNYISQRVAQRLAEKKKA